MGIRLRIDQLKKIRAMAADNNRSINHEVQCLVDGALHRNNGLMSLTEAKMAVGMFFMPALAANKDWTVMAVNPAFLDLLGYTSDDQVIGRNGFALLTPRGQRLAGQHVTSNIPTAPDPPFLHFINHGDELEWQHCNGSTVVTRNISLRWSVSDEMRVYFSVAIEVVSKLVGHF